MKLLSDKSILGGFGCALLLLFGVGVASWLNTQKMLEDRELVAHTHQVLDAINHVSENLNRLGDGRRGYVLTQNLDYLELYKTASQNTSQTIADIQQLTQDNPEQQRRIEAFEPLIAQELTLFQRSIDLVQQEKSDIVKQRDIGWRAFEIQQKIQAKLTAMDNTERSLLRLRSDATDQSVQRTFVLIGGGYCVGFGLLIGVYFLLQKQIRDRHKAEISLLEVNKQLQDSLQQHAELNTALKKEVTVRLGAQQKLEQLAVKLKRSNQELEQFAYVASHDLQEPLRTVTSYTQMLERRYQGNLDEKADKYIHYVVDGATRMQQLINDLLAYSRLGKNRPAFQPIDGDVVLERALRNLHGAIADSNAIVTHDALPTVTADAAQLIQLFQNLVGNAIKYHGDEPPKVHVSAVQQPDEWIFSVQDNGIGIDAQYAERIFAVFQRLHTRRNYSGTGIGLAICKKILELHKGRIWVESQSGAGSTFFFTIPIAKDRDNGSGLENLTLLETSYE